MTMIMSAMPHKGWGQTECNCADYPGYQCITFDELPALIATGKLKDYEEAKTEPQFVVIRTYVEFRDLTNVDPYTFAPGSHIIMGSGSALILYKEVIFNDTHIESCDQGPNPYTWSGIIVADGGTLRVNGGTLENGCEIIGLRSGSKAEITGVTFQNNWDVITAEGNVQLLGEGISHNTFDGTIFPNGCGGVRHAIFVQDAPYFKIGNDVGGGAPNVFFGYGSPVSIVNSNIDIHNSTFFNFSMGQLLGTAVWLRGTNGTYKANIFGTGSGSNNEAIAFGFQDGIRSTNYDLKVRNAFFDQNVNHVNIYGDLAVKLNIAQNGFDRMGAKSVLVSGIPFLSAAIDTNVISDNLPNEEFTFRNAIDWRSNSAAGTNVATIRGNTISDDIKPHVNPATFHYDHTGIQINNSSQVSIEDNLLSKEYINPGNPNTYVGISLRNSGGNQVIGNTASSVYRPLAQGFRFEASANNVISCNHATHLAKGFAFNDNCDHANFRFNDMEDNAAGLALEEGNQAITRIGKQFRQGNRWSGELPAGGVAEAIIEGQTPNPATLQNSIFVIHDLNTASAFWANPRVPANGWFLPANFDGELLEECMVFPPIDPDDRFSAAERSVVDGSFATYSNYPAVTWDAMLQTYGTLEENADLRSISSATGAFYQQHQYGNVGKLHRALHDWENVRKMSASLVTSWASNDEQISQKLTAIRAQQAQMPLATPAAQHQIAENIAGLQSDLVALQQVNQHLSAQYRSEVNSKANLLLTDLSAIAVTEVWEQNLKTFLTISADRLLTDSAVWTATQYSILAFIADQCRYEGGMAVVLARSAIEKYPDDDELLCSTSPRSSRLANDGSVRISPNPAMYRCDLSFGRSLSGTLSVVSLQGQSVFSTVLNQAATLSLDTHTWPAGVYQVDIRPDQGGRIVQKLAIVR
ncbi:MAG TPA: right-handed parallel beta-helix repeat-containing protein [Saprospiraceae bacterium]|nr:right-handed parallel beta-helix repeat-containing protein [Saprospiraceae bacterium]